MLNYVVIVRNVQLLNIHRLSKDPSELVAPHSFPHPETFFHPFTRPLRRSVTLHHFRLFLVLWQMDLVEAGRKMVLLRDVPCPPLRG